MCKLDITKKESLVENGFIKIGRVCELLSNGFPKIPLLNTCGVYAVTLPEAYQLGFLNINETIRRNNVINPWPETKLFSKWVDGVDIVYYGLAGANKPRSLKNRLRDLLNHASGKVSDRGPHKGGEIIWQLLGYEDFEVMIMPTGNPPFPSMVEENLLKSFYGVTGKLPFGNRKF